MVKSLGMVAGAAAVGFSSLSSLLNLPSFSNNEKTLRGRSVATNVLLIGVGSRGQRFARFAKRHPDQLKIAGIGEPNQDRRIEVANAHGVDANHCFNNWKEVCQMKPEAEVVIISASGNYVEICSNALRAGYHVWVDRPASMKTEEIKSINELARNCNRELQFCYIHEDELKFMDHRSFEKKPVSNS
jgi:FlaA1/EpsC-like NDP-sugar epimerase